MSAHAVSASIDPRTGTAYIYVQPPGKFASMRQETLPATVVLDYAEDGTFIGIEILIEREER